MKFEKFTKFIQNYREKYKFHLITKENNYRITENKKMRKQNEYFMSKKD